MQVKNGMEEKHHWDALEYQRHSSAQFIWANELIEKMNLKGGESLLDLGCGEGKISAILARLLQRGRVVGIDSSEAMIDHARKNFTQAQFPNLEFLQMEGAKITFEDCYDVVFSNAALHWMKDQARVLEGVRRSLTPQGRFVFQMGAKNNAKEIAYTFLDVMISPSWRRYFQEIPSPYKFYDPDEYRELLAGAGLKCVRLDLIPKDMVQRGREGLAGWVRSTWFPYTGRVPEDLRGNFIAEFIERYLEKYPLDKQGLAHVAMMRLEGEAVKI
jgi:trans-aconitate 2-methyltransferase